MEARQSLLEGVAGVRKFGKTFHRPWKDFIYGWRAGAVENSFPLSPPYIPRVPGWFAYESERKNILKWDSISRDRCIVYAAGIADDSDFEVEVAQSGCEVHAFDCTINASAESVQDKPFKFHPWCIGVQKNNSMEDSLYTKNSATPAANLSFISLQETMRLLGHDALSLFKFDIEGHEWDLIEAEILEGAIRPFQLSFELHTKGSNLGGDVPRENVIGKTSAAVNCLLLRLFDVGYRVISKEYNPESYGTCIELVLVNVEMLRQCR